MNPIIELNKVIETLQIIDIKASYDNCNHMLGSLQMLIRVRDYLAQEQQKNIPQIRPVPVPADEAEPVIEIEEIGPEKAEG